MAKVYNVLVVDDDKDIVELVRETLSVKGEFFNIISADNGQMGYIKAKEALPDLIILDIIMPRWDGFQTFQKLQSDAITKNIPVIFLTAVHDKEDITKAKSIGVKHYLVKPFDTDTLLKKVKELIGLP